MPTKISPVGSSASGGGTVGPTTPTDFTEGSVIFAGASELAENNAAFNWSNSTTQLKLTAGAATRTPLAVVVAGSQTADAVNIFASNGTTGMLAIGANGTIRMGQDGDTQGSAWSSIYRNSNGGIGMIANAVAGDAFAFFGQSTTQGILFGSTYQVTWSPSTPGGAGPDVGIGRTGVGIVKVTNGSTGAGALHFQEQTAPAAPAADNVYIYAEDSGGGKTRLMARFATGAAVQFAIEP